MKAYRINEDAQFNTFDSLTEQYSAEEIAQQVRLLKQVFERVMGRPIQVTNDKALCIAFNAIKTGLIRADDAAEIAKAHGELSFLMIKLKDADQDLNKYICDTVQISAEQLREYLAGILRAYTNNGGQTIVSGLAKHSQGRVMD